MSDKQDVLRAIRKLPDDASFANILEEIKIAQGIREGEQAIDAGDVMPHEEFKRQIEPWLTKSNGAEKRGGKSLKSSA